jgi:hypothetical protein
MSFRVINGREIELLDEPDFFGEASNSSKGSSGPDFTAVALDPWFEPKPVSPKRNNVLFADNSGNIHIKIEERENIKRKPVIKRKIIKGNLSSILGKRKIQDAFGSGMHDEERYGREIPPDFFKTNIGHGVYPNQMHSSSKNIPPAQEAEIIDWCYKYLQSKKT